MSPRQPMKLSDLDKSRMKRGGLPNIHFCKKHSNIAIETEKIVSFHFSHYKPMETISCHSDQSSYPTRTKHYFLFPRPVDAMCVIWKNRLQRRSPLKMLMDDGGTDGWPVYTKSSSMSLWLR